MRPEKALRTRPFRFVDGLLDQVRLPAAEVRGFHLAFTRSFNMSYEVRNEGPSVDTYIEIRLAAGLSRKSPEAASIGLRNGLFSVVVYSGEYPVGIGRVIGDGCCFFEIVDIAVRLEHQKKGLGDMVMKALMVWIRANVPSTAYVSLMADHGTPMFYERYGFEPSFPPKKAGMSLRID